MIKWGQSERKDEGRVDCRDGHLGSLTPVTAQSAVGPAIIRATQERGESVSISPISSANLLEREVRDVP